MPDRILGLDPRCQSPRLFGRYIAEKINVQAPRELEEAQLGQAGKDENLRRFGIIVAMITAASLISPVTQSLGMSQPEAALVVMAIASGATILSQVNDSGFWIVGKYLGMNEKQTLRSWTVMETIIAVSGLLFTLLASVFV